MPRNALFIIASCLLLAACRQDMHDAPRYDPLEASTFFANGGGRSKLGNGPKPGLWTGRN